MNDTRNSFVLYNSYVKHVERLSMEQRGSLFTAILYYSNGYDLPEMDPQTEMAFSFIQEQMDVNSKKYEETIQRKKEAGRNGGVKSGEVRAKNAQANEASASNAKQNEANEASASNAKQNEANEASASNAKQNEANEADNVNDNENENDNDNGNENENDLKPKKESVLTDKKEKAAGQEAQSPPKPQSAEEETVDLQEFDDLPDIPPGPKQDYESDFEAFWELYPKQRSKALARKVWYELLPDEDTVKAIMQTLPMLINSEDWKKNGGKYIPNPANWLKAEGWEDNPTVNVPDAGNRNDSLAAIDEWGIRYRAAHGGDG